jgi:hypothetical protein
VSCRAGVITMLWWCVVGRGGLDHHFGLPTVVLPISFEPVLI